MKIIYCEQRSEEWFRARLGKMTASEAQAIGNGGEGLASYVYRLLSVKFSGNRKEFSTPDTERGNDLEDQAIMTYEIEKESVEKVGFIEQDRFVGCSPDGLVGKDGGVEVKCPNDVNFFKLLVKRPIVIPSEYLWQVQMCLLVSERKWWDLIFYNPNFQKNLLIFRQEPDLEKRERLIIGLEKGKQLIKELTQKYESANLH